MTPPWPPPSDPTPTAAGGWPPPRPVQHQPPSPWTPPPATDGLPAGATRVRPLLGWLLVVAALAVSAQLTGEVVWASGVLQDGGRLVASQGALVSTPEYQATIMLAFAGLGGATFFGVPAVPWSRTTRWVVTGALAVLVLLATVVTLTSAQDSPATDVIGGFVLLLVPVALLLVLVWTRVRRGCALVALVFAAVGAVAHVITLGRLLTSAGAPAGGAWAMLVLVLVGLAGATLLVLTTPPRDRVVTPARRG